MENSTSAFAAWTALQHFFLDNRAAQAMFLDKEFGNTVRGEPATCPSPNTTTASNRSLTQSLADVDEPVKDPTLTMYVIDSLGKKFEVQAEIIQSLGKFPTFAQARSRLMLAEASMAKKARNESAQALFV